METAIGVFASRDRAEDAVKQLLAQQVPEPSIVFLTPTEDTAQAGNGAGTGISAILAKKIATSLMSVPGIGRVFALGKNCCFAPGTGRKWAASGPEAKLGYATSTEREMLRRRRLLSRRFDEDESLVVVRSRFL